jgi:hypothetical protein
MAAPRKAKAKTAPKARKTTAPKSAKKQKQASAAVDKDLIKVCLCDRGQDAETPWAVDLGPATGKVPKGSRRVRLVNVPFFHAKPTWGDTIVVSPVEDGLLTWDAKGVAWSKIATRIDEDGGRYAMIVDYIPRSNDRTGDVAFAALSKACHDGHSDLRDAKLVCEGAYGPQDDRAGRVYLAVVDELEPEDAMARLTAAKLPCELVQIHPPPPKATKAKAKPKAKAKAKPATAKRTRAGGTKRAPRKAARRGTR